MKVGDEYRAKEDCMGNWQQGDIVRIAGIQGREVAVDDVALLDVALLDVDLFLQFFTYAGSYAEREIAYLHEKWQEAEKQAAWLKEQWEQAVEHLGRGDGQ